MDHLRGKHTVEQVQDSLRLDWRLAVNKKAIVLSEKVPEDRITRVFTSDDDDFCFGVGGFVWFVVLAQAVSVVPFPRCHRDGGARQRSSPAYALAPGAAASTQPIVAINVRKEWGVKPLQQALRYKFSRGLP